MTCDPQVDPTFLPRRVVDYRAHIWHHRLGLSGHSTGLSYVALIDCPCGGGTITRTITIPAGDEHPWRKDHECHVIPEDLDAGPNRRLFRDAVFWAFGDRYSDGTSRWHDDNHGWLVDRLTAIELAIAASYQRGRLSLVRDP